VTVAAAAVLLTVTAAGAVRWLRVAQREHYLAGSVSRFWWRWLRSGARNALLWAALAVLCVIGLRVPAALLAAAAFTVVWPLGLTWRGHTGRLAWTRRLRTVAASAFVLAAVVGVAVGVAFGPALAAALLAIVVPFVVDGALLVTAPLEARLADRHLRAAAVKLGRIDPLVVAITGSYGKTSTKEHVRDLLAGSYEVVASPASFNNKAGLSRAINEQMNPSCQVFVAEMGTYGPGEIRELCAAIPPDIAVITAIGPVHLERMGTLEGITAAKAEILERARTAVLNVDSPELARLARAVSPPPTVVRCGSAGASEDVAVLARGNNLEVWADGAQHTVPLPDGAQPDNIACAIAAARAVGVSIDQIMARLPNLRPPAHRAESQVGATGVVVVDDTYNANPEGARHALRALAEADVRGRRVVVTPGMVELGTVQAEENRRFARDAAEVVDEFVVVNRTNRAALTAGARAGGVEPIALRDRAAGVAWVRSHLHAGDAVLYENDLPDHYP
jgi:UDP-N-acetylmuramoyl-tripeptide--D-alanyl-D-alanine ligase